MQPRSRWRKVLRRLYDEWKAFIRMAFYLYVIFASFALYEAVVSREHGFRYEVQGLAIFNALCLGKIMAVAEHLRIARWLLAAVPVLLHRREDDARGRQGTGRALRALRRGRRRRLPVRLSGRPGSRIAAAGQEDGCPETCARVILASSSSLLVASTASGSRRANMSIMRAMSPVQPVWWLAPRPAPLSPWKYS